MTTKWFFLLSVLYFGSSIPMSNSIFAQEKFSSNYNFSFLTMDNGLLHNDISHIHKDNLGFIWISTKGGGLSRYDGYTFKHFTTNSRIIKINSNFIESLCEDNFHRLWIISVEGINIINLSTLKNDSIESNANMRLQEINSDIIHNIFKDSKGNIWLFGKSGLHRVSFTKHGAIKTIISKKLNKFDVARVAMIDIEKDGSVWFGYLNKVYKVIVNNNQILMSLISPELIFNSTVQIHVMLEKEHEVWIGTNIGLYRFNRNKGRVKQYNSNDNDSKTLSQNYITDIIESDTKQLIVSTLKGMNIYNPLSDNFERISTHKETQKHQLNSNFINFMLSDNDIIWIGTDTGGVNILSKNRLNIKNYIHDKNNLSSLANNPVNAIFEDKQKTIWVGNVEGGLSKLIKDSNKFTHYTMYNSAKLSHNTVSAIHQDNKDRLWVGSWGYGITLLDLKKSDNKVVKYITPNEYPNIPITYIESILFDPINNAMWIGTRTGIFFYDLSAEKLFNPFTTDMSSEIPKALGLQIDSYGNLWVGSVYNGAFIVDLHSRTKKNTFSYKHLKYKLDSPESKFTERISCIYESSDKTLWIGSDGNGFYKLFKKNKRKPIFKNYNVNDGLINNNIRGIIEDKQGLLWISTNYGVSCFNPLNESFLNYTIEDGFINNQFYWNAFCKSNDGDLYFGGINGLSAIRPNLTYTMQEPSKVIFTNLKIKNEDVQAGGHYLSSDISYAHKLEFQEKDNSFSLEFSPLNFKPLYSATYSYRLLGFENEFTDLVNNRNYINFTNLPPGNYTLQIKYTTNSSSENNKSITELPIIIKPYFYKTWWFISSAILIIIGLIITIYRFRISNLKKQKNILNKLVDERTHELTEQNLKISKQKEKLLNLSGRIQQLTNDRITFFTNITHEFRTPITLIAGPISRALKLSTNDKVKEQLVLVEKNSKYLLSLVNQLMDFRKIESGDQRIIESSANFISYLEQILEPFETFMLDRNIELNKYYHLQDPVFMFDPDAIQKIITNLLSNAIKFTPNEGKINIYIANLPLQKECLFISVKDTGIGISENEISKIFDQFYQAESKTNFPVFGHSGTGIGLYLISRILKLLNGSINVKNNKGPGSSFRVLVPIERENSTHLNYSVENTLISQESSVTHFHTQQLTILVVEDNTDMRNYINSILEDYYNVLTCTNGQEALNVLLQTDVDFIISDLMMPIMNGMELSKHVKQNFKLSHIPFLMLTANTTQEARVESYRQGADEYISKPFSEELLLVRIQNIIECRKKYRQNFSLSMNMDELQIDNQSRDKKFMEKLIKVVKSNYSNSHYSPGNLILDMGFSKNALNNKILDITGLTTGQFLLNYRLSIAYELIKKNKTTKNMNVSEIAYSVGFNDPKYFTRCFVKHYNITPSKILEKKE